MKPRAVCVCELCKGEASLYCVSDSAFLCWSCDAKVHEANFLVSRHVRRTVCVKCKVFDGNCISGVGFRPVRSICGSCSLDAGGGGDLDSSSSSSSVSFSDCTSSAESFVTHAPRKKILLDRRRKQKIQKIDCSSSVTELSGEFSNFRTISDEDLTKKTNNKKKKRREDALRRKRAPESIDAKAKGILVNWSRKLGLQISCTVPLASHAFGVHLQRMTVLPFRVSLASSLWLSVKSSGGRSASTWQNLKRLEEISGVPAKVILMAESKLSRMLKMRRSRRDLEEGWAECS